MEGDGARSFAVHTTTIDIWVSYLPARRDLLPTFERWLSDDEKIRAKRFHFQRHREAYLMSRGMLREILSCYLDQSPKQLQFHYGQHGKPHIPRLAFNLSHSHDYWALAVTDVTTSVGIDIEWMAGHVVTSGLIDHCCSEAEQAVLDTLNAEQKVQAFFNSWTRKEALIKALGCGLSFGLKNITVTVQPEHPPRLLALYSQPTSLSPHVSKPWQLENVTPHQAYCGAVAWQGERRKICYRTVENHLMVD